MINRYNVDLHYQLTVEAFDEKDACDVACEKIGEQNNSFKCLVKSKAKKVKKVD